MKPSRRERMHEATREEIKTIAWGQIAEHGAAALSLRAIAQGDGHDRPRTLSLLPGPRCIGDRSNR